MSWSFNAVGNPDALRRALDEYGSSLGETSPDNLSRQEFDEAKPHLQGLLSAANQQCAVLLNASGYASKDYSTGVVTPQNISVEIRQLGALRT